MRLILASILLTVAVPLLSLAAPFELEHRINGHRHFLRILEDGAEDEIHLFNDAAQSWRLLVKGKISKISIPGMTSIQGLPARVKLLGQNYPDDIHVVIDERYAVLVNATGPKPGQARYLLPDSDVTDVEHSAGMEYKGETYRVFSYQTKQGAKTLLVRRSDGKFRLLAAKRISFNPTPSLRHSIVEISALSKKFDLNEFETGPNSNLENLRKINLESEELRTDLQKEIFGQDSAINAIVKSFRELKTNTTNKPRVLLAMGPSGTGKSFTAEAFAELKANGLVMTIKGNEFNSHAGSLDYMKLLGGSKGTTAERNGELIDWLKLINGKSGVLIIDEGDKMHPDIWLKLMEFLNTGILTDFEGKALKATNLTIFITTNRGVKRMYPSSSKNWSLKQLNERTESFTQEQLKGFYLQKEGLDDKGILPQEVLNRIDEFIPYAPLSPEAAIGISKNIVKKIRDHYEIEYGVHFNIESEVLNEITLTDFDGSIDGRAVKRKLSKLYSDALHLAAEKMDLKSGHQVQLELNSNSYGQKIIQVKVNDQTLPLMTLGQTKISAIEDPQQAQKLLNVEAEMNKELIGQQEAMREISEAVIAHAGMKNNERPLVIFLAGISGNGKTETGRALAKVRYESENRIAIIPLGGIQSEAQFDSIFGISAQYKGGDSERIFEKALRENPDGAVLVFDEISNMGGLDRNQKESLMMKFYDFFEQGRYISPIDGRVYELGKYTLVLTGNDGQEAFRGITSDDLLLTTWEDNRAPEKIRRMMLARGWPMALINRIALKLLLKPTLSTEIGPIAQKLLNREIEKFQKENPSIKVNFAPDFSDQLAKAFFSPDQGARGLRDALETKIRAALIRAVIEARATQTDVRDITINMDLVYSRRLKPYKIKNSKDPKVEMNISADSEGTQLINKKIDLTEYANSELLLTSKNATLVSYHEAGHAVLGQKTTYITIRGGRAGEIEYYGYAREDQSKKDYLNMDRSQVIQQIATLWAGRKAQELAGFTADSGWTQDLEAIRKIMTSFFLRSGLDRDFVGIQVNQKGEPQLSEHLQNVLEQKMAQMEKEGEVLAEKTLVEQWPLVRAITAELLRKGEITDSRIQELKSNAKNLPYRGPRKGPRGLSCQNVYTN